MMSGVDNNRILVHEYSVDTMCDITGKYVYIYINIYI